MSAPHDFRPFAPARRRTAEHMLSSRATSAHAFVAVEVDYEQVERARRAAAPPLTLLPFVVAALARAVATYPLLNASVVEGGVVVHPTVDVGIAVDLGERGLVVPVVRDAAALTVAELGDAIATAAARARARKLLPAELRGGTITVTNLGMFGTVLTIPIINQPQVAILATDGVRPRPVAVAEGDGHRVEVRATGTLGLSFDHRAFDGAYAAGFLQTVADTLGRWED
jgi:2-oxoglutarate dehydrogenase E2 component (dihydrolipoamide succinyltransferase)